MSNSTSQRENRSPSPFIQAMTPDERKEHMSRLARQSHAGRLQLSAVEREKLLAAYRYLGEIAARHGLDIEPDGGAS